MPPEQCGEDRVKPAPFAYERARSLDHAIELISGAEDARLLAGGQIGRASCRERVSSVV